MRMSRKISIFVQPFVIPCFRVATLVRESAGSARPACVALSPRQIMVIAFRPAAVNTTAANTTAPETVTEMSHALCARKVVTTVARIQAAVSLALSLAAHARRSSATQDFIVHIRKPAPCLVLHRARSFHAPHVAKRRYHAVAGARPCVVKYALRPRSARATQPTKSKRCRLI